MNSFQYVARNIVRLLKIQDVCAQLRVSRSTLWRLCRTEGFPKPLRFGPSGRSIGFLAHEIDDWLEAQASARDQGHATAREATGSTMTGPTVVRRTRLKLDENVRSVDQTDVVENIVKELDLSHPVLTKYQHVITSVMHRCGPNLGVASQQLISDELAGALVAIDAGKHVGIRSIQEWLLAAVNAMERGAFTPGFAEEVARWRNHRAEALRKAIQEVPLELPEEERRSIAESKATTIADLKVLFLRGRQHAA